MQSERLECPVVGWPHECEPIDDTCVRVSLEKTRGQTNFVGSKSI